MLVKLLAVAKWRRSGWIRKGLYSEKNRNSFAQRFEEKSQPPSRRSSEQGCFRNTSKHRKANNHHSNHYHYPAKAGPSGQPSESGDLGCRVAIGCPYTAAPKGQANTLQRCKSRFSRLDGLRFMSVLSSLVDRCPIGFRDEHDPTVTVLIAERSECCPVVSQR